MQAVRKLAQAMDRFFGTGSALRELSAEVVPVAARLDSFDSRLQSALATHAIASLPKEQRDAIAATAVEVDAIAKERQKVREANPESTSASDDDDPFKSRSEQALSELIKEFENPAVAVRYFLAFQNEMYRRPRKGVVLRALQTSAVAAFESLVGEVILRCHDAFPALLPTVEKEFSLDELEQFGSVADVRSEAIARRVDDLLRKGLDEWRDWLLKKQKIDLQQYACNWDDAVEMVQRRHLLVHHDGKVSSQYLQKVSKRPTGLKVGQTLPTTVEYVQKTVDELTTIGLLLGCGACLAFDKNAKEFIGNKLLDYIYVLMEADRWESVRVLCREGRQFGFSRSAELVMQVNEWLAIKRLGRFGEISRTVADWDCSALTGLYAAAKHALLDQTDQLFADVRDCVAREEITRTDIARWPLFRELREHPRFTEELGELLSQRSPPQLRVVPPASDAKAV